MHFDFESDFKKNGAINKININKNEMGLLFEIYKFYLELDKYNDKIFD